MINIAPEVYLYAQGVGWIYVMAKEYKERNLQE